jgi:tartrate-resistant acid phosphatase type 5
MFSRLLSLFFYLALFSQNEYVLAVNARPETPSAATQTSPGFISIGDWGSAALGGYHLHNAEGAAAAMKTYITNNNKNGSNNKAAFVLNTGDNFYYCGIQNTSDPQINEDYTALFGGMGIPWYNSLGNHDYGFSPEAQLALNDTIPGWIMDGRYYHRRVVIPAAGAAADVIANIIVLDTNPCVRDYRGDDRKLWDPCGTEYPDCSPIMEPCRFHENILSQDCETQLEWAKQTLAEITSNSSSTPEWVFVVGHHKAEEINVADFQTTFLDDPRIHLYLNGHTHNLEHYSINGQAKYMTTGAGGMVIIGAEANTSNNETIRNHTHTHMHAVKSLWSKIVTGFSSHTFMNDGKELKTEFWGTKAPGILETPPLYEFTVVK